MPDRPFMRLLQTIQQRAQAAGREAPIATRLLTMLGSGSPVQAQTPAPAVQQRPAPQPSPAATQASAMASYAPMQRPGGPTPSPMASFAPMQRPEMQSAMASYAPMQRPGPPLPQPNPERMPMGMPMMGESAPMPEMAGGQLAPPPAPQMAAPQGQIGPAPGWTPANVRPDTYGPGMAVPRGTSTSISDMSVQPPGFDALLAQFPGVQGGGMAGAQAQYNSLPTPQRRNIEVMNMQQLRQFINSADPNSEELRRANIRLEQLRVEALMMGQGVVPGGAPMGPPMGPGM